MGKIWDISPGISKRLSVFPGDVQFKHSWGKDYTNGDPYSLSSMSTTMHIGSHADAPYHFNKNGETIDQRNLEFYYGPCFVIDLGRPDQNLITVECMDWDLITVPRILFKTNSFDPNQWSDDFVSFDPNVIDKLAQKKVMTIGIDTPSVDPAKSKTLPTHQKLYEHNMANIEGLSLEGVPEGFYNLSAIPLKIIGAEAAPLRAILVEDE